MLPKAKRQLLIVGLGNGSGWSVPQILDVCEAQDASVASKWLWSCY